MRRTLSAAGVVAAIAALAITAIALAGSAKVSDPNEKALSDCQDYRTIKGVAKPTTTTFTLVVYGQAAAKPCKNNLYPQVQIDRNDNGVWDPTDCSLGYDKFAHPKAGGVYCNGKKKAGAKYSESGKTWTISFKTSVLGKSVKAFRFYGQFAGPKGLDDAPDSGRAKPKRIKVG
jgi:hypothetical protein